ncbi:MAG: fused response regulator/phosphatase [Deltaproteobacteria bacterium]|nr:fused response regulator/phosphatase [Deltaproteobacteria bacterium]
MVVLLIDDQAIIGAAVKEILSVDTSIEFHFCQDPTQAIETALFVHPTVILQDLVMPEVDGLTLVRFLQAHPETKDIPLIVLSSREEAKVKAEAFSLGANDYLVKLPDPIELRARVRYHSQAYIALLQRNAAFEELATHLAEAATFVRSLLPLERAADPKTRWIFQPSTHLGGDAFGYHAIDDDHFALYLLDVCGHGVGAALLAVSVINVIRAATLRDVALRDIDFRRPEAVLAGLNQVFPMEANNDMFFSLWYGVYQRSTRTLRYSSGGHPPALFLAGEDRVSAEAKAIRTTGPLVGALPASMATFDVAELLVPSFATLYLYSDGAFEITSAETGKLWTLEAWLERLETAGHANEELDGIVRDLQSFQGRPDFDDDVAVLQLTFET